MTEREEGLAKQGERLRAWRKTQRAESGKPLSQAGAAERLGASQSVWAEWELGKKAPSAFFAGRIERLTAGKHVVRAEGWAFRRANSHPSSSAA